MTGREGVGGITDLGQSTARPEPVPSFSDCVIGMDFDEPTHVLYDSRYLKRATAIKRCADEYCIGFSEAKCETVYYRWLTDLEVWQNGAGETWWDDRGDWVDGKWTPADDGSTEPPAAPPEGWEPDPERDPTITRCKPTDAGAVKCWQVATGL